MPRNVRNFWVKVSVDDRKTPMEGGPKSKGGGFSCVVYQRSDGSVSEVCRMEGTALGKELHLQVKADGRVMFERTTKR